MADNPSDDEEKLISTLTCGLCKNVFDDEKQHPCVLPCLVRLCFRCLQNCYPNDRVFCPCCPELHTFQSGWSTFPRDTTCKNSRAFLQICQNGWPQKCEMCEKNVIVSHRCKQCEIYICNECVLIHKRVRKLTHHELLPLKEVVERKLPLKDLEKIFAEVLCSEHREENQIYRIYCSSCRKPICSLCAIDRHNGHVFSLLPKVYAKENEASKILHSEVESHISEIEKTMESVIKERKNIASNAVDQRNLIKDAFTNAHGILNRKLKEHERKIEDFYNQKSKILCSQTESLQFLKDSSEEACLFLKQSLSVKNKPAFLEISQSILLRFQELCSMSIDSYPHATSNSFRSIQIGKMVSFQKIVNALMSVVDTQTNNTYCQFSCPSHCRVDDVCEISIDIASWYRSQISDKNFQSIVTKNEEIIKEIKHNFSRVYKPCVVIWKPTETGTFKWTLRCNGINIAEQIICVEGKDTGTRLLSTGSKVQNMTVLCIRIGPKSGEMAYSYWQEHAKSPLTIFTTNLIDLARNTYQDGSLSILYNENKDILAFGLNAEEKFVAQSKECQSTSFQICTLSKEFFENSNETSLNSESVELVLEIINLYLRHFEVMIDIHKLPTWHCLKLVLIVPEKLLHMQKSLIAEKINRCPENIAITSETDAIVCLGKFLTTSSLSVLTKPWYGHFSPGCRYMLLNCEVSSHATLIEADKENMYRTLLKDKTLGLGYIYGNVLGIIKDVLGENFLEVYKQMEPFGYLSLMDNIYRKQIASMKSVEKFKIPLYCNVLTIYKQLKGKPFVLKDVMNKRARDCVSIRSGNVFLHLDFVLEDAFQRIIQFAKQILCDYQTNTIIMYGDLAKSEYFLFLISKSLPDIRIISPEDADLSLLTGGVISGFH